MGLFDVFSKKVPKPYRQDASNIIYDMLFCDDIELYNRETKGGGFPGNILFAKRPEIEKLRVVAGNSTKDSRYRILANNIMLSLGAVIGKKELLGVVVEVGLHNGLDALAAYQDGTARYINHTGKILVWENKTDASEKIIGQLFAASVPVIEQIERIDNARRHFPQNGNIRLTFLVSDGMYFWEGPFEQMHQDDLAGVVINAATDLLTYLSLKK